MQGPLNEYKISHCNINLTKCKKNW